MRNPISMDEYLRATGDQFAIRKLELEFESLMLTIKRTMHGHHDARHALEKMRDAFQDVADDHFPKVLEESEFITTEHQGFEEAEYERQTRSDYIQSVL